MQILKQKVSKQFNFQFKILNLTEFFNCRGHFAHYQSIRHYKKRGVWATFFWAVCSFFELVWRLNSAIVQGGKLELTLNNTKINYPSKHQHLLARKKIKKKKKCKDNGLQTKSTILIRELKMCSKVKNRIHHQI